MNQSQLNKILESHKDWLQSGKNGTRANLGGADLSGADLRRADLSGADLRRADLIRADLSGADLRRAKIPIYCRWNVSIKNNNIVIGCEEKSVKEWDEFFYNSSEKIETERNTPEFERIRAMYEAYKAYLKIVNDVKT